MRCGTCYRTGRRQRRRQGPGFLLATSCFSWKRRGGLGKPGPWPAGAMGGYLVLEEATPEIKQIVGVGMDTGASSPAIGRLKAIFDPKGVMNPGLFAREI